ncbi:TetR/AcrR family transcriptional regulator [Ktedonosporobacter rubrisoli]|uniref:TetR/AcrR family transcriptional regulator n=1 Tax=Ktedonosporobacter rubrisoli TaxID=2509675 RepID=A0A4P6JI64_KTERU|nr:TetR/AcrR family transcriptional regulator [Ktedonosporobacter rubrisoli]QBD74745.1 TetR/AcrR family transcriptional regulator [Ktedonosporobacter rubrisoli]
MSEERDAKRTQKGELARQSILESALTLFGERGYEETTMREIAAEAGYSPGLTYRYFSSKEELVLALYQKLCAELDTYTHSLPSATLPELFYQTVSKQLELMAPYRQALSALFGAALNSRSHVGVFGKDTADIRRQARKTYLRVLRGAKDAPKDAQCEELATILYGSHLAMVLFWLIDESDMASRTRQLLAFLRDMLKLLQPLLWLPPVALALRRLATILGPLLGDERQPE